MLPDAIERILQAGVLLDPERVPVSQEMTEVSDSSVSASGSSQLSVSVSNNEYLLLVYRIDFHAVEDSVFTLTLTTGTATPHSGTLRAPTLDAGLDTLLLVTKAHPLVFNLTNGDSSTAHAFTAKVSYVRVESREAWTEVQRVLRGHTEATKHETGEPEGADGGEREPAADGITSPASAPAVPVMVPRVTALEPMADTPSAESPPVFPLRIPLPGGE